MRFRFLYRLTTALVFLCLLPPLMTSGQAEPQPTQRPESASDSHIQFIPFLTGSNQVTIPTATAVPPTAIPTTPAPGSGPGPTPSVTRTPVPIPEGMIVADHTAVDEFDQIPRQWIEAASQISFLFRHASVGGNINDGLDCLMNAFSQRPHSCDRDLAPEEIFYSNLYDRRNWDFEYHAQSNPNPGWWEKINLFISRVDSVGNAYDVVGFKFGYVDDGGHSQIQDKFFSGNPNDNLPGIEDLEALEARHPNTIFMYWTMGLARSPMAGAKEFNEQMRAYAYTNRVVLLDIADIQSHRPDGSPCLSGGIPVLCENYTQETNGGHLNARGKQRMAKAVWWIMARLAGWPGN